MPSLVPLRTLRGNLTLLACVATLPAFLFVVYVATSERRATLRRAESDARFTAELASREHASQIAGAGRLLDRLASIEPASPEGLERLRTMLTPVLSGFPQVANLGILDLNGNVTYSVVPAPGSVQMRDNPAFTAALRSKDVVTGAYQLGKIVGRPVLIMARAVRDRSGSPQTVLFAALELTWLAELARQADVPPETALLIADREGTVLASSRRTVDVAPARIEAFGELTLREEGMTRIDGIDGTPRLCVAAPLRGATDLWVVVGVPEAKLRSMGNRVFYRDLTVLALFAAFAIAASVVAADVSVLRDLRLLAAATRRFGSGDLTARSPVAAARGEIRDVTTAFNSMAAALEQRDREATEASETLRALTHRMQSIREDEAGRIAQEMHDELGQELTVLKLELENIRRKLGDASPAVLPSLEAMSDSIDEAVHSVRRISSELRPGVLDRLGVTAAIEWLLREFERRTAIRAGLQAKEIIGVDSDTATALFRITQEALTNITRHAGASSVAVDLAEENGQLVLRIRDDGRGFDTTSVRRTSLGILGMKERARRLGGTVDIVSAPGRGTELTARIPRAMEGEECTAS